MNTLTLEINNLALNSNNLNNSSPRAEDGWFECLLCFKSKGLFDINKVCEECVDTQVFETSVWASVSAVDLTAFDCYHTVNCVFCGDKLYALQQDCSTTENPVCHGCLNSLCEVLDAHHSRYRHLMVTCENEDEEYFCYHEIIKERRKAIDKGGVRMQNFLMKRFHLRRNPECSMAPEKVPCVREKRKKDYEEEKEKTHFEWNHRKQKMETISVDTYLINCYTRK